jgi:hypothetical protein
MGRCFGQHVIVVPDKVFHILVFHLVLLHLILFHFWLCIFDTGADTRQDFQADNHGRQHAFYPLQSQFRCRAVVDKDVLVDFASFGLCRRARLRCLLSVLQLCPPNSVLTT